MSALSSKITSFFIKNSAQNSVQELQPQAVPASVPASDTSNNVLSFDAEQTKPIPRYLQLARSIHTRISSEEEKELAVYRAAESQAARKNEVIMRAVQEVVDFCTLLQSAAELGKILEAKALEITDRLYSNRSQYTIEHEPIIVRYDAPMYQVDLHEPDHIRLTGEANASIQISFNPVKFIMTKKTSSESSTVTQYLLSKQYRITADGTFHRFTGDDKLPADPIAEILTDLRLKLGFEFFEKTLLPFFETDSTKMTNN
jgi:hypothetical protein